MTSTRTFHASMHKRICEFKQNRSRSFTVVMLQNTAESMFAFDLARIKRNGVVFVIRFSARQRQPHNATA